MQILFWYGILTFVNIPLFQRGQKRYLTFNDLKIYFMMLLFVMIRILYTKIKIFKT